VTKRPVGRPPRISRQAIAEAAAEVGLEDLTLKAVAERLGVSVPSLYHHVDGRDDLVRLAAEHTAQQRHRPVDTGQHWSVWLLEWARWNREAFLDEPGLLGQYIDGALTFEAIVDNAEAILAGLCRQGFTAVDAQAAYELVSSCAIGRAVSDLRRRRGSPSLPDPGPDHPHLRELFRAGVERDFDTAVTVVLRGIAAERGERWASIARRLRSR
jgi:AcrR family transcriptional regulator